MNLILLIIKTEKSRQTPELGTGWTIWSCALDIVIWQDLPWINTNQDLKLFI